MNYPRYILKTSSTRHGYWRPVEIPVDAPKMCPFCFSENVVGKRKIVNGGKGYTHYMQVWVCADHLKQSSTGLYRIFIEPLPKGTIIATENPQWGQMFQEINPCTKVTADTKPLERLEKRQNAMTGILSLGIALASFLFLFDGLLYFDPNRLFVATSVFIVFVAGLLICFLVFVQKTTKEKNRIFFGDTQDAQGGSLPLPVKTTER